MCEYGFAKIHSQNLSGRLLYEDRTIKTAPGAQRHVCRFCGLCRLSQWTIHRTEAMKQHAIRAYGKIPVTNETIDCDASRVQMPNLVELTVSDVPDLLA